MANVTIEQGIANVWGMRAEIWQAMGETFIMVGLATTLGVLFGTLLGIWLYTTAAQQMFANRGINRILNASVNFMRAFPFVILMIALIPLTRIIVGTTNSDGGFMREITGNRRFWPVRVTGTGK